MNGVSVDAYFGSDYLCVFISVNGATVGITDPNQNAKSYR